MTQILHKAASRGLADHGWLLSRHTFSFANYHNPERMGFGLLRVINDDIVQPDLGFDAHPHQNMEIISIPLVGALRHQDSMGNKHVITAGDVQVMSAGSGLVHSEYNASTSDEVNFLQIWIKPKVKDIPPRYGQQRFERSERRNRFQTLVSPEKESAAIWINQDAWLSMASLEAGASLHYSPCQLGTGQYFFVISGQLTIAGQALEPRDGLGLVADGAVQIDAAGAAEVLCIEVAMK